jgi:hypothetical protein
LGRGQSAARKSGNRFFAKKRVKTKRTKAFGDSTESPKLSRQPDFIAAGLKSDKGCHALAAIPIVATNVKRKDVNASKQA